MGETVRDPSISFGPFRVYLRTDRVWIVVDERLPAGERTVWTGDAQSDAEREAKALAARAELVVIANHAPIASQRQELFNDGADAKTPRRRA